MGIGIVIRDFRGSVKAAMSKPFHGLQEPVVGEAMAALFAVEFGRDIGVKDVIMEGDSLITVNAIRGESHKWSYYGHIIEDIKVVLSNFHRWEVGHIRREGNAAAHHLAKWAIGAKNEQIWVEETPRCIEDVVLLERLNIAV